MRAVAVAAAALAAGSATALAQNPELTDPYTTGEQLANDNGLDTDHSPNYKETDLFQQVAGSAWDERQNDPSTEAVPGDLRTGVIFDSATSFDDNLYTVAFSEQAGVGGFAGGASCEESEPNEESGCTPVLYQYGTFDPTQGPEWKKVDLPGEDKPGYIGEVAWIARTGRALAVGGTGTYPRREPAWDGIEDPVSPEKDDPAGKARVWLYEDGTWTELELDRWKKPDGTPLTEDTTATVPATPTEPAKTVPRAGMRGLTAFACDPSQLRELCFAGALGQIWKWENGRFSGEFVDARSPASQLEFAPRFRFRVRDIQFLAGSTQPVAVAVTSGCCTSSPLTNVPRMLTYAHHFGGIKWRAHSLAYRPSTDFLGNPAGLVAVADSANSHQQRPDSLYSVMVRRGSDQNFRLSAIAAPGGPAEEAEPQPPSRITPRYCIAPDGRVSTDLLNPAPLHYDAADFTRTSLNTARLVAGDGDLSFEHLSLSPGQPLFVVLDLVDPEKEAFDDQPLRGSPATHSPNFFQDCANTEGSRERWGDAVPDWVVGELRSTRRQGLGSRGLLVANPLRPGFLPETVNPNEPALAELADGSYRPTTEERLRRWAASQYYLLPSYGLSSIDIVGDSATGWAVGDHGAILRLDAEQSVSSVAEPDPPRLGSRRPAELPERSPYEAREPAASGDVGPVPGLASRPEARLPEPRFVAAGSPDPSDPAALVGQGTSAREIAISRDGSEGWAVGPLGDAIGVTTLYRYDGASWSLCDFFGVEGQLPPDPACEGIAGIRLTADANGAPGSVRLRAIARVPLEADSDPTNDDELEAVAVGSGYIPEHPTKRDFQGAPVPEPVVLRYRDGRWEFEDRQARAAITEGAGGDSLIDVAFTAPDDGWILSTTQNRQLFHFDGERWIDCTAERGACADTAKRTAGVAALGPSRRGLVAVGERVYLFGGRPTQVANTQRLCPVILYHERGASSWVGGADGSGGAYDPGFTPSGAGTCSVEQAMSPGSLTVGRRPDGSYEGWVLGQATPGGGLGPGQNAELRVLRLTPQDRWEPYERDDALSDYFSFAAIPDSSAQVMVPAPDGGLDAFIVAHDGKLLAFNRERGRWELAGSGTDAPSGADALAPDGQGGFWAAEAGAGLHPYFYRYTDHPPREVFSEAPNPAGAEHTITAAAAGPGGSFWLATGSEALYRYDRVSGWDRLGILGWDPGRVVTQTSQATAIAINEQGEGVVVGEEGRIAEIAGAAVSLDRAAGTLCDLDAPAPPCGTGRDLGAAAVAPDGSAIVAGESLALLWRPAGGEFRAIPRPDAANQTAITGVAMPAPDRAWITTDTGFVFAGRLGAPGQWSWALENVNERGDALTLDRFGQLSALRAIAIDAQGRGFAVGDRGVILERLEDGWRRLDTPFLDDFTSVALPWIDGDGALIGARRGAILTYDGERFELARSAEPCCGGASFPTLRPVVGLALLPAAEDGQVEAWAAVRSFQEDGSSQLLHYASDPTDALISPAARAESLPDVPPPREGELSLAAFGHTECLEPPNDRVPCASMVGRPEDYEVYAQRIVDELAARAREPGGPAVAIFSGDTSDRAEAAALRSSRGRSSVLIKLRRFSELVADRLEDAGVPLLGAIGGGDLSAAAVCPGLLVCVSASDTLSAGESSAWREAMAARREPWGRAAPPAGEGLILEPAPRGSFSTQFDEQGIRRSRGRRPRRPARGARRKAHPRRRPHPLRRRCD